MSDSVPSLALIVAMASNGVIGRDGDLPWRMASDLKWFKRVTMGKPIVMGRTTFDSIGRPLPGRANIVLTRQADWAAPTGVIVAASLDAGLAVAREEATSAGADEVCVIGGANVYEQALELADRLYLTFIEADIEGDRHFPLPKTGWQQTPLQLIEADERNDFPARIERWDRLAASSD